MTEPHTTRCRMKTTRSLKPKMNLKPRMNPRQSLNPNPKMSPSPNLSLRQSLSPRQSLNPKMSPSLNPNPKMNPSPNLNPKMNPWQSDAFTLSIMGENGLSLNLYTILFIAFFGIGYGAYYATADMPIPMVAVQNSTMTTQFMPGV